MGNWCVVKVHNDSGEITVLGPFTEKYAYAVAADYRRASEYWRATLGQYSYYVRKMQK